MVASTCTPAPWSLCIVNPAEMRATRDLLRRRMPFMRQRAELLTPIHNTHRQYNLPEIGKKIADKANRDGVAERFPDPAVHESSAADLALIGHDDEWLRDVELSILKAAKQDGANTLSWLCTVPGIGEIVSLVLLYEMHDSQPGFRLLLPSGQVCQGIGRQALWHLGHEARPYLSPVGLL